MKISTFYQIYYKHRFTKANFFLKIYLSLIILIRFLFNSDPSLNKDGFYFDDLRIRVIASTITDINQTILMGENIVLSPNPSNGIFNLSNADGKEIGVEVFNSLGQLVYQQKNNTALNSTINIQDQAAGIYFVNVSHASGNKTVKFIKQ